MSAIALWKRRGKERRLGFDLRLTGGPKDEKMKLKPVLGFAMAAVAAMNLFAATETAKTSTPAGWTDDFDAAVSCIWSMGH